MFKSDKSILLVKTWISPSLVNIWGWHILALLLFIATGIFSPKESNVPIRNNCSTFAGRLFFYRSVDLYLSFSFDLQKNIYFIFYWISVLGLERRSVAWSSWRKGSDPTTWPRRSVRRCRTFSRPWERSTPPKQSPLVSRQILVRVRAKFSWSSRHLVSIDIWTFPSCIAINV